MPDYSPAEASMRVIGLLPTRPSELQLGEACDGMQPLYKKASDGKHYKALAAGTEEQATVAGLSMHGGSADDYVSVFPEGAEVFLGASVTAGDFVCVATAAGGLMPHVDAVSGEYISSVGYGNSDGNLVVKYTNTGATEP